MRRVRKRGERELGEGDKVAVPNGELELQRGGRRGVAMTSWRFADDSSSLIY